MELDLKERNRKSHLFIYGIYFLFFFFVNKILVHKKYVQPKKSTIWYILRKGKDTPIQSNLDHQKKKFYEVEKTFALNDYS